MRLKVDSKLALQTIINWDLGRSVHQANADLLERLCKQHGFERSCNQTRKARKTS